MVAVCLHTHYAVGPMAGRLRHVTVWDDGGSEVVFEVTDWTPEHKDFPPAVSLDVGELQVNPGDTLRTTCTYDNQTGEDLPYPAEMCSLEMVAMPLDRPLLCVDGWYIEGGEDRWGR